MTSAIDTKAWFWQAWLATMVFVFPIPHTIALRNLLLLVGFVVLLSTCRKTPPKSVPWLKPAARCLIALTAWIAFHSVVVAPEPALALDQFRANWAVQLLLGAIAAWAATQLPREGAARAIVAALAAHIAWLLAWQFNSWLFTGSWPFKVTPFAAYDYQGTLNSFLLALLLADRLAWTLGRYSPLGLGPRPGWVLLLLSLSADIGLQSRGSTIVSLFLVLAASLVLLSSRSRHWRSILAGVGLVSLLGMGSLSFDSRWQRLSESAAAGWSSSSTYWMTGDWTTAGEATRPRTPSGALVEESAYVRAAWARQAVNFIADHPLGIGFGHDAFGRFVAMKYKHPGMGSSHCGWLDFALGTGLAGLVLLLATAGMAIHGGWREFRERKSAQALLLVFFVGGYTLRCLLDGHLSGWRLGMFAFVVGGLIAGMRNPRTES